MPVIIYKGLICAFLGVSQTLLVNQSILFLNPFQTDLFRKDIFDIIKDIILLST